MGNMIVIRGPRELGYADTEDLALKPGEVRLEMLYSGISAGTQLTLYRGNNPYLTKSFNADLRVFEPADQTKSPYPIPGAWAYEEVGRICELGPGVTQVSEGMVVYGTWGHRTHQVVSEEYCLSHLLPEELDPVLGIYSQMGAIAMNAILDADIHVGETVAVLGQGVPGQIVSQLARLNGADVIAVDRNDYRLNMAKRLGAFKTINSDSCDAGLEIKRMTKGGADKVIEISGSPKALHSAIRSCSYNGKVVCSGFMTLEASGLILGEEFHHNRIQLICSQIENTGPHVRDVWNRIRMEKTIYRLCRENRLDLLSLITHRFAYREAEKAYTMLDSSMECLQTVLQF